MKKNVLQGLKVHLRKLWQVKMYCTDINNSHNVYNAVTLSYKF